MSKLWSRCHRDDLPGVAKFNDRFTCPHGIEYVFGPGAVFGAGGWYRADDPKRRTWAGDVDA